MSAHASVIPDPVPPRTRPFGAEDLICATTYIMGLLTPAATEAFESQLLSGCKRTCGAFEHLRPVGEMLVGWSARKGFKEPRPLSPRTVDSRDGKGGPQGGIDLRAVSSCRDLTANSLIQDGNTRGTEASRSGVRTRTLNVDAARGQTALIIQLDPGTAFPDHDHPNAEECLVLDGDLDLGGKTLNRFDYMRIPKGGQHGTPHTKSGCLLLVT